MVYVAMARQQCKQREHLEADTNDCKQCECLQVKAKDFSGLSQYWIDQGLPMSIACVMDQANSTL